MSFRPYVQGKSGKKYCSRPHSRKGKSNFKKAQNASALSSSMKKLTLTDYPGSDFDGYRIIDIELLFKHLKEHLSCKKCGGQINFVESDVKGLGSKFNIICSSCDIPSFHSSKFISNQGAAYDINRRIVFAMRCIGKGHQPLKKFCGLMDLPPPPALSTYNIVKKHLLKASQDVADEYQRSAVEEEVQLTESARESREIAASFDGTWQKRGFSSKNGVVTAIGAVTGKVLDSEVLSSYCAACKNWQNSHNTTSGQEWDKWYANHKNACTASHDGSASSMEVHAVKNIFIRSQEKHNIKYTSYIGDGDTKSYSAVAQDQPYGPDTPVTKVECVGHVQKRFGNKARKLKTSLKNTKLADGKTIGGKGRLTDQAINQLQKYYGNAIRSNSLSVEEMTKSIWAIYYHKSSTDETPQHQFCPVGEDSWCTYHKAAAAGTLTTYTHRGTLPAAVMDSIRPVFIDLTNPQLLHRCVGGKTQNTNESFNNLLWTFCPKEVFVTEPLVKTCCNLAIVTFSDGMKGILKIMEKLMITPGINSKNSALLIDRARTSKAEKQAQESTKEARQLRRQLNILIQEDQEAHEGLTYQPGGY